MKKTERFEELLERHLAGLLTPKEVTEWENLLAENAEFRAQWDEEKILFEGFAELREIRAPKELSSEVLSLLNAPNVDSIAAPRRNLKAPLAIAATFMVVVGLAAYYTTDPSDADSPSSKMAVEIALQDDVQTQNFAPKAAVSGSLKSPAPAMEQAAFEPASVMFADETAPASVATSSQSPIMESQVEALAYANQLGGRILVDTPDEETIARLKEEDSIVISNWAEIAELDLDQKDDQRFMLVQVPQEGKALGPVGLELMDQVMSNAGEWNSNLMALRYRTLDNLESDPRASTLKSHELEIKAQIAKRTAPEPERAMARQSATESLNSLDRAVPPASEASSKMDVVKAWAMKVGGEFLTKEESPEPIRNMMPEGQSAVLRFRTASQAQTILKSLADPRLSETLSVNGKRTIYVDSEEGVFLIIPFQ